MPTESPALMLLAVAKPSMPSMASSTFVVFQAVVPGKQFSVTIPLEPEQVDERGVTCAMVELGLVTLAPTARTT